MRDRLRIEAERAVAKAASSPSVAARAKAAGHVSDAYMMPVEEREAALRGLHQAALAEAAAALERAAYLHDAWLRGHRP